MLIGAEGTRLLREYGAGETPQAQSAEEAPRHARGKRSAWSSNQHTKFRATFLSKNRGGMDDLVLLNGKELVCITYLLRL
jgi:hypothetical protein